VTLACTVPGNLLIAGEYAVLEPGGLGITAAMERRARFRARESAELEVVGRWAGAEARWSEGRVEGSPLFAAVVNAACAARSRPRVLVEVDSTAFFASPDRKLGYGSSAAVAAGLVAVLLRAMEGEPPAADRVFAAALAAHRAFQGGRGSGYDVATSVYGGTGLFTGGERPSWRGAAVGWLAGALVFEGERSVATPGATSRYRQWKEREPDAARRFLEDSAEGVRELLAAPTPGRARGAFLRLRDVGLRLGEAIGVSAAIEPPPELLRAGGVWKALGAGNEIGLFLPDRPVVAEGTAEQLALAAEGLAWLP
jgi:phosphomevalonate kinase